MKKTRLICWLLFIAIAGCSSGPPVKEVDPFSGLGAVKKGAAAGDLRTLARERIAVVPSANTRNLIRFYADAKDGLAINPDTVLGKTLYADWDEGALVDGPTRVIRRFLGAPVSATDLRDAKAKGATVAAVIDVFSNVKVTSQEVLEGGRYDNTWRFSVIFVRLDANSAFATVDGFDTENCPFGATAESLIAARCHIKARELALAHLETALQERLAVAREAQWKKVDVATAPHMNGSFIDADSIERAGDLATMWHMFDFSVPQTVATDPRASYLSAKVQQEYNCAEKRARVLSAATYADNMARNSPLAESSQPGPWNAVPPNSTVAKLMQYACGETK